MLPNVQRAKVESKSQSQAELEAIQAGMLPNVQRAKVESKSQLEWEHLYLMLRCYQMYKELKLKANHN